MNSKSSTVQLAYIYNNKLVYRTETGIRFELDDGGQNKAEGGNDGRPKEV